MDVFDLGVIAAFFVAFGLVSGLVKQSLLTGPMLQRRGPRTRSVADG